MAEHPIQGLMSTTLQKIKEMVDVNTVIGDPIETKEGTVILPVLKIALGFGSGGSDFPTASKDTFGGGGGAGISMSPVAFLVVSASGDVKLLELSNGKNTADKMVNIVPDIIDKISDLFGKKEEKADETDQSK